MTMFDKKYQKNKANTDDLRDSACRAKEDAKHEIQKEIDFDGNFTHNIISCILRKLADEYGTKYANEIVDELDLEFLYAIGPHKGE